MLVYLHLLMFSGSLGGNLSTNFVSGYIFETLLNPETLLIQTSILTPTAGFCLMMRFLHKLANFIIFLQLHN